MANVENSPAADGKRFIHYRFGEEFQQKLLSSSAAVPIRFSSHSTIGSNIHGLNSITLHQGSVEPVTMLGSYRLYSMRFCPYAQRVLIYLTKKNIPVEIINLINCLFEFYNSKNQTSQQQNDINVHIALRNAEILLRDAFYGGRNPGYADYLIWPFLERLQLLTLSQSSQFRYFPGIHFPKMGAYMARMQNEPEIKFTLRPLSHHKSYFDSISIGKPNYDIGTYDQEKLYL
ncbi:unnamed protein product [Caenorhabditis sp. 36 PRJEB53466]|nr:unnamed protein product [Caenorhabditis sp. 36 PRJEB53466]